MRTGLIAVLGCTALLCSGCGSSSSTPGRDVTVVGSGQVRGAPDTLDAGVGVQVTAADVSAAIGQANARAKAVTDATIGAGVRREDIQTTDLSVQPQYTPDHTVTGYLATNAVHVVIRDLTKASAVLSAAVQAGGNDARINGVSFALDDNSKLLADARARAFADAKSRAEQYAVLAGLALREVKTIKEASSDTSAPTPRFNQGAMPDIPLQPGMETVTFTVTVTWDLG
jgi:uncharacterized protein YggE